jgi:hypothetical protein
MISRSVELRDRSDASCVADNGFCPGLDRRQPRPLLGPARAARLPDVVSVAIGFAIASALALLAHRRRWLVGPIVNVTGILYTIPSVAAFFLLLPITGRGNTTALIALVAYTLLILFRNMIDGPRLGAEDSRDAGPRHGPHRPPAPVAGRGAAGAAGDPRRAARRDDDDGRASPRSRSSPGAGRASARRSTPTSPSSRTSSSPARCACCSRPSSTARSCSPSGR